jgi:drug/metabolite transporter (DMT)-like permease
LLSLGTIWGASFLFIKVCVDGGVEPLGMSSTRCLLGTLTLLPIVALRREPLPRRWRTWALMAFLGFLNFALPWTLFGIAEQHAPSGAASIANSSQPLWAAIIVAFVLRADRLSGVRLAGLLLGFGGVGVLMGRDIFDTSDNATTAILLMVFATFLYATSAVTIRRFLGGVSPLVLAAAQLGFATLFLAPLAFATSAVPTPDLRANVLLSLFLLGALNSGVAVSLYMWLIGEVGPVRAAVVTYLMPPIGVTLGWLFLGESVGWNLAGGLALVVAGVALVQQVPVRALARRLRLMPRPAPATG